MCHPAIIGAMASMGAETIAATQLAITIASTAYGVYAQAENAKAMSEYQNRQFKATQEAAASSAINQYNALLTRQRQEEAAASQAINRNAMQAASAAAAARVTAGEAGTAGLSVDALLNEYSRQELGFEQSTIRNQVWNNAQINLSMKGIQAQQQQQLIAAAPKPVQQPDYVGALLRIGEGALQATGTYYDVSKAQGINPMTGQPYGSQWLQQSYQFGSAIY